MKSLPNCHISKATKIARPFSSLAIEREVALEMVATRHMVLTVAALVAGTNPGSENGVG